MRAVQAFLLRLAGTFRKDKQDGGFAEELEGHVRMHTEDNLRRGMSAEEARRNALMKLGGIEQTKEIYHDRKSLPMLEVFLQDVRYGLRMLRKNPGFTAVAILSLALGIGANTTIFTVVNATLLNALPVRDLPRLVELDTVDSKTLVTQARVEKLGMSYPNMKDYRRDSQVFTDLSAYLPVLLTWSGGAEPRQVQGELVSANYFDVLGLRPPMGRFFMSDEDTKALALIALVGAGLFLRSMQNAQKIDLGIESKNLLVMNFDLGALHYEDGRGQQFYRAVIERAKNSPGIASASIASNAPLAGGFARTIFPEGQDEASGYRGTLTTVNDITPDYFETLRIPLLRGRTFNDGDRKETAVVAIASAAMVKQYWPNENGLGKRFHFFGDPTLREIVGVAANSVVGQVGEDPQPIVFLPMTQDYVPAATLHVRTNGDPESVLGTTRTALQSLDPNLAITNVFSIEQIMAQALWPARTGGVLLTLFGALALVLSAVGVYGVLSYSVNQQTREIGLRMALGAQRADVMRLILGQGLRLTVLGLGLGVLIALAIMRVMVSLLFNVRAYDPSTYTAVTLLLTVVALVACYIPARRAMRVDPMVALRHD